MIALVLTALAAAPQISTVVVYPDRATVTRTQVISCTGTQSVRFEAIPPAADPNSVRARTSRGSVEGLTTREEVTPAAFSAQREGLQKQLETLHDELSALQQEQSRAHSQAQLGTKFSELAFQLIGFEMAEPKPNTRAWSAALESSLQTRVSAMSRAIELAGKQRELQRRIADVQRKFDDLGPAAQTTQRIAEVVLACPSGTATVELSYVVGAARWQPVYEARADEAAGKLDLAMLATVSQATGEDWSNAQLLLSTAVPSDNATPPELVPLRVFAHEQKEKKKVLVRRDEYREHAQTGAQESPPQGQVRAASQGLSVQLEVDGKSMVKGDGTEVRVLVARHRMNAAVRLKTIPKLYPEVFRVTEATNSAPFPLLPGRLEIFGRSGFVGAHVMERTAQGAPLELTLGVDEGFKVTRVVVEELKKHEGLFNSRKRFRFAYRFELENLSGKPAQLEVAEHIPVSELDDVLVELEKDKTTAGHTVKADDGILSWKADLKVGEKKVLDLAFHVDVPSSYDSEGL